MYISYLTSSRTFWSLLVAREIKNLQILMLYLFSIYIPVLYSFNSQLFLYRITNFTNMMLANGEKVQPVLAPRWGDQPVCLCYNWDFLWRCVSFQRGGGEPLPEGPYKNSCSGFTQCEIFWLYCFHEQCFYIKLDHIVGFVDSLPLFKKLFISGKKSNSQTSLV